MSDRTNNQIKVKTPKAEYWQVPYLYSKFASFVKFFSALTLISTVLSTPSFSTPIYAYKLSSQNTQEIKWATYSQTKKVIFTFLNQLFRKPEEEQETVDKNNSRIYWHIIKAIVKSDNPNKLAVIFSYVQADILQNYDKTNKNALQKLDKDTANKVKELTRQFEQQRASLEHKRLMQIDASMKNYAALSEKADQLRLKTLSSSKRISKDLSTPIHQRKAFKAGLKKGKDRYKLYLLERGVSNLPETNDRVISSDNELIEADKKIDSNAIKPKGLKEIN